jgi:DedD protein
MAWFNFGKKDSGMGTKASVQKPVETVDAMRQRAKYRLIGAVVLVLAGVVGFPMLFDSQPRPVVVDMPIEIPDKAKVRPLGAAPAPSAPVVAAKVDDSASLSGKEEIVSSSKPDAKAADKKPAAPSNNAQTASKTIAAGAAVAAAGAVAAGALKDTDKAAADAAKAAAALEKSATEKVAAEKVAAEKARKLAEEDKAKKLKAQIAEKTAADKVAEASRAKALLDGAGAPSKPAVAATAGDAATRYIVQFGAFSDADKAQEARRKVEKAGLKTYSQVAKTADGDRIRVRVGPFTNKDEADKAAAKIKALALPASILTL